MKYRKISPKIWNDAKFRTLSDDAKLVFFMLLTHPSTSAVGTLRAYIQGLAPELGWTEKAFREAFAEASKKGMVKASEKDGLIWLPNFMKYNSPESPNVLKSWAPSLDDCPECPLKTEVYHNVKAFAEGLSQGFAKAFAEAFQQPLPNQEQEQEQEQEKEEYSASAPLDAVSAKEAETLFSDYPSREELPDTSLEPGPESPPETEPCFYLTKKKRKLTGKRLETFNVFWTAFAYARGKAEAADAWMDIPKLTDALVAKIIAAAEREAVARPGIEAKGQTPKWAQGWLTGRRWEDEPGEEAPVQTLDELLAEKGIQVQ